MTKKILYFVLLSVLIMSVGYDIQTGRIQFGSSRINDSTSALMTMNKGALINGDIRNSPFDFGRCLHLFYWYTLVKSLQSLLW